MVKKILLSFVVLFAFSSGALFSQTLYGSGISPESALVRVIFTDDMDYQSIQIGSVLFDSSDMNKSALYHPVAPGMYYFEIADEWVEIIPMSGKYYTLIITGGKCLVFNDIEHTAPAKNQIYFYNALPDDAATLYVTSSGDPLFENLKAEQSVQRAVNPLDISFSIKAGGSASELGALPMSRGGSTALIVYRSELQVKTFVCKAEILKEP